MDKRPLKPVDWESLYLEAAVQLTKAKGDLDDAKRAIKSERLAALALITILTLMLLATCAIQHSSTGYVENDGSEQVAPTDRY